MVSKRCIYVCIRQVYMPYDSLHSKILGNTNYDFFQKVEQWLPVDREEGQEGGITKDPENLWE